MSKIDETPTGPVTRIPTQFRELPQGARCRCLLLMEENGKYYCCQINKSKSMMAKRERVWSETQSAFEDILSNWTHDPSPENSAELRAAAISYLGLYIKDGP